MLSSSPRLSPLAGEDAPPELPAAIFVEPGSPREKGEVVLDWKPGGKEELPIYDYWGVRAFPVYSLDGRESGRGPGGFLATLNALRAVPEGSRLRVEARQSSEVELHPGIHLFPLEFRELVAAKRFTLVVEFPKKEWPKYANCPARCRLEWRNFRSLAAPHDEVVYLIDGKVAGMGSVGFDAVLKRLRELPSGAYLQYPQYWLHPMAYDLAHARRSSPKTSFPLPIGARN